MGGLTRALAAVGPQALHERAPLVARMAHLEVVGAGLADPALVLGAGGAQVADHPPLTARQEVLRVLPAQQRAPADVTGDVELVGAYVPGASHETGGRG